MPPCIPPDARADGGAEEYRAAARHARAAAAAGLLLQQQQQQELGRPASSGDLLLVCSYTDYATLAHTPKGDVAPAGASGVAAFAVDAARRELVVRSRSAVRAAAAAGAAGGGGVPVVRLHNAAFLLKHPSLDVVYASTERIDREGSVVAMRMDAESGALTLLNSVAARGRSTCYLNLDAARGVLNAVNYWDARLAALGVDAATGALEENAPRCVLQQKRGEYADAARPGREEHWAYRQRWAHTHCAVTEPYTGLPNLFVCDLGEDQVLHFVQGARGGLARVGHAQLPRGVGPRHLVFHPSLRVAYVVNELDSSVSVLDVSESALRRAAAAAADVADAACADGAGAEGQVVVLDSDESDGGSSGSEAGGADAPGGEAACALSIAQTLSTLPPEWQGRSCIKNGVWKAASHCSEIKVHPSGRFVFVANRGHDSLAVFAVDPGTGGLSPPVFTPSGGATPRNFSFCCGGRFVVVGNQDSNCLCLFEVDERTGALELAHSIDCPSPNYVYAVPRAKSADARAAAAAGAGAAAGARAREALVAGVSAGVGVAAHACVRRVPAEAAACLPRPPPSGSPS
eukprot:PRCOL_00006829-RA